MAKIYINTDGSFSGPNIFGSRLKEALIKRGHKFVPFAECDINLAFISGAYKNGAKNILRLDGLILDSEDELRNQKNKPMKNSLALFDHIVFQSEFSKRAYEAFFGAVNHSTIIYNGTPQSFSPHSSNWGQDHPLSKFEYILVASADWRRHKRGEEAIAAVMSYYKKDICLLVIGGAGQFVVNDNVPNIFCTERVLPNVLPSIYNRCDAMIHLAWLDWCPNTVIEELSCGLPVLCSSNGGTKELVRDQGVCIELEEEYIDGTLAPLYNPPSADLNKIHSGIDRLLEIEKINTKREDLDIDFVAQKYEEIF